MKYAWLGAVLLLGAVGTTAAQTIATHTSENLPPVVDLGPRVYVEKYARLKPRVCYDPEGLALQYVWEQTGGPEVAFTWNPTDGTLSLDDLQPGAESQFLTFELVVHDEEGASTPARVEIVIVADYGDHTLSHMGGPFDPNKPTFVAFGSGNCVDSFAMVFEDRPGWEREVNWFTGPTAPPYRYAADRLIKQLNRDAPDYRGAIQVFGFSTGGLPALEVSRRLNRVYADSRYMVNRITLIEAVCQGGPRVEDLNDLTHTVIDGETCWIDCCSTGFLPIVFNVRLPGAEHFDPFYWYEGSHRSDIWPSGFYNDGIMGGYALSVMGPARNLYVPPCRGTSPYYFIKAPDGEHLISSPDRDAPGRLPEPVILVPPTPVPDANAVVLTCLPSAHTVTYEVLVGADPHRIAFYECIEEANEPPLTVIDLDAWPYDEVWGTIRARNAFDATIHADPIRLDQ
jgi:hypothetical protein